MKMGGEGILSSWREECGVFGIWNHPSAARLTYLGLFAMQHRGQESAGIVTHHNGEHFLHRGLGLVGDVFSREQLATLMGAAAIGHVRYSTTGINQIINAQPLTAQLMGGSIALAHNGNIVNAEVIRKKLQSQGAIFQGTNDTECLLHLLARHGTSEIIYSLLKCLPQLEGAYSMVVLAGDRLIAVRDPQGFRPLVLGTLKNEMGSQSYVIASETCAFDLIGAEYKREIEPGEIFWVDHTGAHSEMMDSHKSRQARCVFEYVYFSRPDSQVFGKSVYEVRKTFGKILAREKITEGDIVIPVPESGVPAAIGYAEESKVPFDFGIIRNHYVGRTFIQPDQSIRDFGVKIKLNPQASLLKNKRVIVIDDSLVRGTTSRQIIRMVREAGAKEVHLRIAAPPTKGPCFYGVDTPQKRELIASHQSVEDIRRFVEADSLEYLSLEGMWQALNDSEARFCAACFDGKYPTQLFE